MSNTVALLLINVLNELFFTQNSRYTQTKNTTIYVFNLLNVQIIVEDDDG